MRFAFEKDYKVVMYSSLFEKSCTNEMYADDIWYANLSFPENTI